MLLRFLFLFLLVSCGEKHLHNRIVVDEWDCKYLVRSGVGDTVFLSKIETFKCKASK